MIRVAVWTGVVAFALAVGLLNLASVREVYGNDRFLAGYVVADITPPLFKLAQNLAGIGILVIGFRVNWVRWRART